MATESLAAPGEPVVLAAIDWMVRLQSGSATEAEHAACRHWRDLDAQHELAWQRLQGLAERVSGLPPALAHGSIGASPVREHHNRRQRRFAIKTLSLAIGTGMLALAGGELLPWRPLLAQYRTGTGQRRRVTLADGTVLDLNTATAVDTAYSDQARLIYLQQGELLVSTATEAGRAYRPFLVQTRLGQARALGTRFQLRDAPGGMRLAVFQGAVEFRAEAAASATRVDAGQQGWFDRNGLLAPLVPAQEDAVAWVDGVIVANRMRLGELVTELDRYMPGKLRCDEAIAGLPISGVFPIDQPARILAALARTLPLRIDAFTDYWITLRPRVPA